MTSASYALRVTCVLNLLAPWGFALYALASDAKFEPSDFGATLAWMALGVAVVFAAVVHLVLPRVLPVDGDVPAAELPRRWLVRWQFGVSVPLFGLAAYTQGASLGALLGCCVLGTALVASVPPRAPA